MTKITLIEKNSKNNLEFYPFILFELFFHFLLDIFKSFSIANEDITTLTIDQDTLQIYF